MIFYSAIQPNYFLLPLLGITICDDQFYFRISSEAKKLLHSLPYRVHKTQGIVLIKTLYWHSREIFIVKKYRCPVIQSGQNKHSCIFHFCIGKAFPNRYSCSTYVCVLWSSTTKMLPNQ